jgi:hypothetical protein
MLMMYIVAVFFTQQVTTHVLEATAAAVEDGGPLWMANVEEETLTKYFGSLERGMLSLFQSMSGGLDWDQLANPLFTEIGFFTGMAFTGFVAFALLALMNVVTGVFVQTALLSARNEEDSFMQSQIVALFHVAEHCHGDTICWDEVLESLEEPSTAKEWKSIGVQAEDARYVFKLLDVEGTGEVAFEEFMGGCLRIHGDAKALDLLTVMQESRKNEDFIRGKVAALTEEVSDMHTSIREIRNEQSHINEDIKQCRKAVQRVPDVLAFELSHMRQILGAFSVLEDALALDSAYEHAEV